jgi:uracil phosphoribosyltransferase
MINGKTAMLGTILIASVISEGWGSEMNSREVRSEILEKIQMKRHDEQMLSELLPIVHCSFQPSTYEEILVAQLRNTKSSTKQFRIVSDKISDLLVNKVIDCLPTRNVEIETPLTKCPGKILACRVQLVSIMRSGDALLETFMRHFPEANVSKFLIQRDERTARPQFKYMKVSPEISSGDHVVITEPMIATGGTLDMVITLLKEKGVKEENIIVASICVAPEGLILLNEKFPRIKVVMTTMDEKLNERKYIVPGLGDFGDRFFGTSEHHFAMNSKDS